VGNKFGLIRYPGSKAKLFEPISAAMPEAMTLGLWSSVHAWEYREPFFGSGAIGFRIMPALSERCHVWLNDKDYWLVCLWKAVKEAPQELCRMVRGFKPSAESFLEFKAQDGATNVDPLVAGFRKLAIHQMSVSGFGVMSGTCLGGKNQDNAKYPVGCRWNPIRLSEHIENRHRQMSRFGRRMKITCRDFSELMRDCSAECFVYLDPPYVEKGCMLYKHGMDEAEHRRLAECVRKLPCPWLLSYDDHPLVRSLYAGMDVTEIELTYTNATNARVKRPKNKEILIAPHSSKCGGQYDGR
jgi:DNA adenine methylase